MFNFFDVFGKIANSKKMTRRRLCDTEKLTHVSSNCLRLLYRNIIDCERGWFGVAIILLHL